MDMSGIAGRSARRTIALGLGAAILSIAPAFADDATTRERIESRLAKADLAQSGQVDVDVENGVAVLSGFTTTVDARNQAEKAARKVTKTVDNRLRVVPVSEVPDAVL